MGLCGAVCAGQQSGFGVITLNRDVCCEYGRTMAVNIGAWCIVVKVRMPALLCTMPEALLCMMPEALLYVMPETFQINIMCTSDAVITWRALCMCIARLNGPRV